MIDFRSLSAEEIDHLIHVSAEHIIDNINDAITIVGMLCWLTMGVFTGCLVSTAHNLDFFGSAVTNMISLVGWPIVLGLFLGNILRGLMS